MSPKAKSVAEKLLAKGAKIALVGAPPDQRDLFDPAEIAKGFEGVRLVALDDTEEPALPASPVAEASRPQHPDRSAMMFCRAENA